MARTFCHVLTTSAGRFRRGCSLDGGCGDPKCEHGQKNDCHAVPHPRGGNETSAPPKCGGACKQMHERRNQNRRNLGEKNWRSGWGYAAGGGRWRKSTESCAAIKARVTVKWRNGLLSGCAKALAGLRPKTGESPGATVSQSPPQPCASLKAGPSERLECSQHVCLPCKRRQQAISPACIEDIATGAATCQANRNNSNEQIVRRSVPVDENALIRLSS